MSSAKTVPIGCGCQRDGETYAVTFSDLESLRFAMQVVGCWAANPDLSFTWYDCAQLSCELRKHMRKYDA